MKKILNINKGKNYIPWNKLETYLFPFLAMSFVLMEKAFLFNPFILMILFVSFSQGGFSYFLTFFSLSFSAFLVNPSYGMEILLISIVQFFISFSLARLSFKGKYKEYYDVFILSMLISLLMLFINFSFVNLGYCILSTILTYILRRHFSMFIESLYDKTKILSELSYLFVFTIFLVAITRFLIISLIVLRIFFLCFQKENKPLLTFSFFTISFAFLYFIMQQSMSTVIIVLVPCVIISNTKLKPRYLMYLIISTLVTIFIDPLFYSNGLLYQNIIAAFACLIIPKTIIYKFLDLFRHQENSINIDHKIDYLMNFLNMMDFNIEDKSLTPIEAAVIRLKSKVCYNCDHFSYCKLTNKISSLIILKLSSNDRKIITKECVKPYKLTLELQQAYQIYLSEESYYSESIKKRNLLFDIVQDLHYPLLKIKDEVTNNSSPKDKILNLLEKNDIDFSDIKIGDHSLAITSKKAFSTEILKCVEDILYFSLNTRYILTDQKILYLNCEYFYHFSEAPFHDVSVSVYSKSATKLNGDSYVIENIYNKKAILLCDGMGHDEKAHRTSQKVSSSFMNLYKEDVNVANHLERINRLFRLCSTSENYSTFDFVEIDLQSLELTSYKAGSMESYIIRDKDIMRIPIGGLPLGAIDECDFVSRAYKLEKDDTIILISDGFESVMSEIDKNILLSNLNEDEIYQNIFNYALTSMKHLDDITMIVCKVL